jgi:hypothetical protein
MPLMGKMETTESSHAVEDNPWYANAVSHPAIAKNTLPAPTAL